jgi:thymidylate synthase
VPTFGYFRGKFVLYTDPKNGELKAESAYDYSCEAKFLLLTKQFGCTRVVYKQQYGEISTPHLETLDQVSKSINQIQPNSII